MIDEQDLLWCLCHKDRRHPTWEAVYADEDPPPEPRPKGCYCDSCFYGRDKLALEILRMREALSIVRQAGNNEDATARWMQEVAAWGMEPEKWSKPSDEPPARIIREGSTRDA